MASPMLMCSSSSPNIKDPILMSETCSPRPDGSCTSPFLIKDSRSPSPFLPESYMPAEDVTLASAILQDNFLDLTSWPDYFVEDAAPSPPQALPPVVTGQVLPAAGSLSAVVDATMMESSDDEEEEMKPIVITTPPKSRRGRPKGGQETRAATYARQYREDKKKETALYKELYYREKENRELLQKRLDKYKITTHKLRGELKRLYKIVETMQSSQQQQKQ